MGRTFWRPVMTALWKMTFVSVSMFNWKVNVKKKTKKNPTSSVIWVLSQHYISIFCWLCAWTVNLIRTSVSWTDIFCVPLLSAVLFLICCALFLVCNLYFFNLFWQPSSRRICVLTFPFFINSQNIHFFTLMQNAIVTFCRMHQSSTAQWLFKTVLYNSMEGFHMISLNAEVILVSPHWVAYAVVSICLCALTNKKQVSNALTCIKNLWSRF